MITDPLIIGNLKRIVHHAESELKLPRGFRAFVSVVPVFIWQIEQWGYHFTIESASRHIAKAIAFTETELSADDLAPLYWQMDKLLLLCTNGDA